VAEGTQLTNPQFLNVLRGDNELVGRAHPPVFFEQLATSCRLLQRAIVRRATGSRSPAGYETSMAEKLAHDLEWIAIAPSLYLPHGLRDRLAG